jgi:hypothetical protein
VHTSIEHRNATQNWQVKELSTFGLSQNFIIEITCWL